MELQDAVVPAGGGRAGVCSSAETRLCLNHVAPAEHANRRPGTFDAASAFDLFLDHFSEMSATRFADARARPRAAAVLMSVVNFVCRRCDEEKHKSVLISLNYSYGYKCESETLENCLKQLDYYSYMEYSRSVWTTVNARSLHLPIAEALGELVPSSGWPTGFLAWSITVDLAIELESLNLGWKELLSEIVSEMKLKTRKVVAEQGNGHS
ncbi:hypothetical protein EVAR_16266_1 [Eumeta japonica]|uniref:Uncharacterized protein n=1 Tax=Eumeta variegata TaxID=151549 RepID=A0A4C1U7B2_EUMVA|nr:hypothetical protein EVAR_16266_1 [Eumeta japonica]